MLARCPACGYDAPDQQQEHFVRRAQALGLLQPDVNASTAAKAAAAAAAAASTDEPKLPGVAAALLGVIITSQVRKGWGWGWHAHARSNVARTARPARNLTPWTAAVDDAVHGVLRATRSVCVRACVCALRCARRCPSACWAR